MAPKKDGREKKKNIEEFEIVDQLNYQKHPEWHTKIFGDPLNPREIPDELFAPKKKKRHVFQFKPANNETYFREKTH
jgi:hypothetical protein